MTDRTPNHNDSNNNNHNVDLKTRFRQRLAWLGRMPWHYRILFGTQAVIVVFAFQYRLKLIEKHRHRLEEEESQVPITAKK